MKQLLRSKKGSSLIMVLGAMLILTAVGVLVITMSSANIRMSSQYNKWSEEYYDLDYAAQERLIGFDSATLVPAEQMARYYLQNNYFTYESAADFPVGEAMATTLKTALTGSGLQEILHEKQLDAALLLTADESNPNADPQEVYDAAMKELARQTFDILFYLRVSQLMGANISDDPTPASNGINTLCQLNTTSAWFPAVITSDLESILQTMAKPQIKVTAFEPALSATAKKVTALATIKSPGYELLQQTRYVPLKINPLYTNAVSVGGGIIFSGNGSVTIDGDVVSSNSGASKGLPEHSNSGVMTTGNVNVTVRGNLYSAGDIHTWANGSEISVLKYTSGFDNSLKNRLYQNDYYYGDTVSSIDTPFTEGYVEANSPGYIPFIYRDNEGGNAYCNSLAVESGIQSAVLNVEGDLWTQDDIQNDGGAGAVIRVGGSYIGMSSDASANGDPNGSSAIINNGVLEGSSIEIVGNYIIPGTAFYVFNGGKGSPSNTTVYYQTAESGSARTIESFAAYLSNGSGSSTTYFSDSSGEEAYILYGSDMSSLDNKINYFKANYEKTASSINVKDSASYYSLGVVVDSDGTIRYDNNSSKYLLNRNNFSLAQPAIAAIFLSKTQNFGTAGRGIDGANGLVNSSFGVPDASRGFYYYGGSDYFLPVSGTIRGIIYAEGNLTLTGSGTIEGTVICRGNLTVQAGVSIVHNAEVILSVLGVSPGSNIIYEDSGSRIARRFFSPTLPLDMGEDLATEQIKTVSTNAGERTSMAIDRYTVNSWRESH